MLKSLGTSTSEQCYVSFAGRGHALRFRRKRATLDQAGFVLCRWFSPKTKRGIAAFADSCQTSWPKLEIVCNAIIVGATTDVTANRYSNHLQRTESMADIQFLVTEHADAVWRTVHRVLENEDDARDCYQQTFLDAMRLVDRDVKHWRGMLCRIALRRSMDVLRRRYRDSQTQGQLAVDAHEDIQLDENLIHQELRDAVRSVLVSLPSAQSEAFWLRHIEQLSHDEIAEQMSVQSSHVRVLVHRAIKRLRVELGPRFDPSTTLREKG